MNNSEQFSCGRSGTLLINGTNAAPGDFYNCSYQQGYDEGVTSSASTLKRGRFATYLIACVLLLEIVTVTVI